MQTAATPSRLMWTRSEIAEAAGVSTATVDRLIADGTLPAQRLGPGGSFASTAMTSTAGSTTPRSPEMPPKKSDPVASAQGALEQARDRMVDLRSRMRLAALEHDQLEHGIQLALHQAGTEGKEPCPEVAQARERLAVIEREARDLEAIARGAEAAVARAEDDLVTARRTVLPQLQAEALAEGEALEKERQDIQSRLSDLERRESELQRRWAVEICPSVPTYTSADVVFEPNATRPVRLPTDPHPSLVWLVPDASWPAWLHKTWRASVAEFGSYDQRRAAGVEDERDRLRREATQPIGAR
jgi:hypothetical protein